MGQNFKSTGRINSAELQFQHLALNLVPLIHYLYGDFDSALSKFLALFSMANQNYVGNLKDSGDDVNSPCNSFSIQLCFPSCVNSLCLSFMMYIQKIRKKK